MLVMRKRVSGCFIAPTNVTQDLCFKTFNQQYPGKITEAPLALSLLWAPGNDPKPCLKEKYCLEIYNYLRLGFFFEKTPQAK